MGGTVVAAQRRLPWSDVAPRQSSDELYRATLDSASSLQVRSSSARVARLTSRSDVGRVFERRTTAELGRALPCHPSHQVWTGKDKRAAILSSWQGRLVRPWNRASTHEDRGIKLPLPRRRL